MKNNDKVTLTLGQLKKLIKEDNDSKQLYALVIVVYYYDFNDPLKPGRVIDIEGVEISNSISSCDAAWKKWLNDKKQEMKNEKDKWWEWLEAPKAGDDEYTIRFARKPLNAKDNEDNDVIAEVYKATIVRF